MKCFTVANVQILPPTSYKKETQLQEDMTADKLGTRYEWLLAHKELLHPLTDFVFNPTGCSLPYILPPGNLEGEST